MNFPKNGHFFGKIRIFGFPLKSPLILARKWPKFRIFWKIPDFCENSGFLAIRIRSFTRGFAVDSTSQETRRQPDPAALCTRVIRRVARGVSHINLLTHFLFSLSDLRPKVAGRARMKDCELAKIDQESPSVPSFGHKVWASGVTLAVDTPG